MKPPRIIYHPAPSPGLDGELHEVRPVDLGRDPKLAFTWIRRRLGLLPATATEAPRFEARRLPDAPAPEALTAQRIAQPDPIAPAPAAPARRELSSEELLAALESDPRLRRSDRD
jgi:hypothetical protein